MIKKLFVFVVLLTLFNSCTPAPVRIEHTQIDANNKTIAILPFGLEKDNEYLEVPDGYLQRFNHKMHEYLFNNLESTLVVELNKSYEILRNTESYDNSLAEFSRHSGADFILTGFVSHYRERVGGDLGVESPASVSFLTRFYDAKTGELLWQYFYTEQQSALFDNIAEVGKFFKRKGKWVTAWELSEEGINITANKI